MSRWHLIKGSGRLNSNDLRDEKKSSKDTNEAKKDANLLLPSHALKCGNRF